MPENDSLRGKWHWENVPRGPLEFTCHPGQPAQKMQIGRVAMGLYPPRGEEVLVTLGAVQETPHLR